MNFNNGDTLIFTYSKYDTLTVCILKEKLRIVILKIYNKLP